MYYRRLLWFYVGIITTVAIASLMSSSKDTMIGLMVFPVVMSAGVLLLILISWFRRK